jgi:DNA invertase Pin-like site-specific DNA recombinase
VAGNDKRAALYLGVSTGAENQRQALEKIALLKGWQIVRVYEDAGRSSCLLAAR